MGYKVEKAGLGNNAEWKTLCNGNEAYAREVFEKTLKVYSVGRFRLVDPDGKVMKEERATPLFSRN